MTDTALAVTVNATEVAVTPSATLVVGVSDAGSVLLETERAVEIASPAVVAVVVAPGGDAGAGEPSGTAAALLAAHEAAADPHPQYQTQAEGDARYAAAGHGHAGTYEPAGAVAAHAGAADPHPQYLTQLEGDGRYAPVAHAHAIAEVSGLAAALGAKVDLSSIGLANGVAALGADGKVPASQLPAAAAGGVSSFNGRAGAVAPAANDYTFAQIGAKPTTLAGYGITDAQPALGYVPARRTGDSFTGPVGINTYGARPFDINTWLSLSANDSGEALFANNAYFNRGDSTFRYSHTHGSLGASGIVLRAFGDAGPWFFDTGDVATTADAQFTPTLRRLWHDGNFAPGSKVDRDYDPGTGNANLTPFGFAGGYYRVDTTQNTPAGGWTSFIQNTTPGNVWGFQIQQNWFADELYFRRVHEGAWQPLRRLWHDGNFNPSSKQNAAWGSVASRFYFTESQTTAMATAGGSLGGLEVKADGGGAAMVAFHRPGAFAAYFGIDTDNQWKVGGWSMGATAHVLWHAGNLNPSQLTLRDTRSTMPTPNAWGGLARHWDFKNTGDTGAGGRAWHAVLTVAPWWDFNYDHPQQQLVWRGDGLSYRAAASGSAWGAYKHLVTSPQQATELFVQTTDPGAVGAGKVWIKPV